MKDKQMICSKNQGPLFPSSGRYFYASQGQPQHRPTATSLGTSGQAAR